MNAIVIKIGMDVHSVNYTLCALTPILGADDCVLATVQVAPDYKNVLSFIENLKDKLGRTSTTYSADMRRAASVTRCIAV